MSDFKTHRLQKEDSHSSDEKMDTRSESFISQDTPNSILSEFEDKSIENVLRLQNPEVLRLAEPENDNTSPLSDSFLSKMSKLNIKSTPDNKMTNLDVNSTKDNTMSNSYIKSSQDNIKTSNVDTKSTDNKTTTIDNRPKQLNIQKSSNLVLTTNHPLMGLNSPDYPDVVPKLIEEKDLSLSSIEDEKFYNLYSPETNTSKNNLYFSENFVTAESVELSIDNIPPDVARVEQKERRKIVARFVETSKAIEATNPHPVVGRVGQMRSEELFAGRNPAGHSTPISRTIEFGTGVAQWCKSPTHTRSAPNFDLPIELSTNIAVHNGPESPEVLSSPTAERSLYEALVDARTGRVSLRPRRGSSTGSTTPQQRRKIQIPPDDDHCSLDSVSVSMDSEDEPPEPEPIEPTELNEQIEPDLDASDDETKKSKSTSTISSERTEPIPEYSAAEERNDQRSWLTVANGGVNHTCDMKVIEPFKRVLSHGGYDASGAALIVLRACFLPDSGRPDYRYVMDNLFLYLIWSLERLVTEEYVLIVLHGRCSLPPPRYLHRCYLLVDRRLRKSLKHLYLVHPTFWIRSVVFLFKPFVSSKFFKKLTYVYSLEELSQLVPVDSNSIPDVVRQYETTRR